VRRQVQWHGRAKLLLSRDVCDVAHDLTREDRAMRRTGRNPIIDYGDTGSFGVSTTGTFHNRTDLS